MNNLFKRMFEDDVCSKAESELYAGIIGKTYDECRIEWSRQFKKEFIEANIITLREFNYLPDSDGKLNFVFYSHYRDDLHIIMKCDNVTAGDMNWPMKEFNITVSFYEHELDAAFIDRVKDLIKTIR